MGGGGAGCLWDPAMRKISYFHVTRSLSLRSDLGLHIGEDRAEDGSSC